MDWGRPWPQYKEICMIRLTVGGQRVPCQTLFVRAPKPRHLGAKGEAGECDMTSRRVNNRVPPPVTRRGERRRGVTARWCPRVLPQVPQGSPKLERHLRSEAKPAGRRDIHRHRSGRDPAGVQGRICRCFLSDRPAPPAAAARRPEEPPYPGKTNEKSTPGTRPDPGKTVTVCIFLARKN